MVFQEKDSEGEAPWEANAVALSVSSESEGAPRPRVLMAAILGGNLKK